MTDHVLASRPGRRTTTLVVEPGTEPLVRKEICAAEFAAAARVARLVEALGTAPVDAAPRLLAVDEGSRTILHAYVPGTPLDRVHPDDLGPALHRFGAVLARVHAAPLDVDDLPAWDPDHPARKLDRVCTDVEPVAPEAARLAASTVPGLRRRLASAARDGRLPVHGDASLRNAPHEPVTARVRLVDWDRAARGPAAVDLAPAVGLLGDAAGPLLAGYAGAGGRVERQVLADLVLANRLTRALRRTGRGADPPSTALAQVAAAVARWVEDVAGAP